MASSILFLINNLERGGAERVFVRQINYLHQRGVSVYLGLLSPTSSGGYFSELSLPSDRVYHLRCRGVLDYRVVYQLLKIARERGVSAIYSTLELPNIFARVTKLFCPSLRVIIREGSAVSDAQGRPSTKVLKFKISDILLNWLAYRIVAVSDEIRDLLARYQPFYRRKMVVIENGVEITDGPELVVGYNRQRVKSQEFRVLAAASMNYYERAFEYLIRAIALLPSELREWTRLVLAGDGTLRPMYEAEAARLGLGDKVIFRGRLNTSALDEEYRRASVFVLCSTAEGSPNVILEAMAHGLPVVTTPVGSAVNMVAEGETGFFIPAKDERAIAEKLTWLAEHPAERGEMGVGSYHRAQRLFSFDEKMTQLEHFLLIKS